jgi:hypothetical protein
MPMPHRGGILRRRRAGVWALGPALLLAVCEQVQVGMWGGNRSSGLSAGVPAPRDGPGLGLRLRGGSDGAWGAHNRSAGAGQREHTRGGYIARGTGGVGRGAPAGSLPQWAAGSAGPGRGSTPGPGARGDGAWWSGAKGRPPMRSALASGPRFARDVSSPVHLQTPSGAGTGHKRLREQGPDTEGECEGRARSKRHSDIEEVPEGRSEDAEMSGDDGEGADEEASEEELDKARLKAMYEAAARAYPDTEYAEIKKAEEEEERMAQLLPRAVLMLVGDGVSEADVCVPVRVLRRALIQVQLVTTRLQTRTRNPEPLTPNPKP